MTIAVAVIDDGSLAMCGAINVLRTSNQFRFAGVLDACNDLASLQGDIHVVLLMDPFAGTGVSLTDIRKAALPSPVLAMSAHMSPNTARKALQDGVRGFISKEVDCSILVDAVSAVGVGGMYLDRSLDELFFEPLGTIAPVTHSDLDSFTPRERDILAMVARGLTHKQIGASLKLSKATVDTYVHRVRQKTGSVNKAGLTRLAVELGLLTDVT